MGDAVNIVNLKGVYVQENGIIRMGDGYLIGRLVDDITYEEVVMREASRESTEPPSA